MIAVIFEVVPALEKREAYLGIAVPEFPNLFLLYGPSTNLGHNSVV